MGGADIQVRPMLPHDEDAVFQLYRDVVQDGGAHPVGGDATLEVFRRGWTQDRDVFVAVEQDRVVGTSFLRPNFPAFAAHIAQGGYLVARGARRRGIGRALLAHSLVKAADLGYRAMMFNLVFAGNPSRALYEDAGFTVIGRIPDARPDEDAFIYWRALP